MKCEKCDREFKEDEKDKAFVWKDQVVCEECLFRAGGTHTDAMTWTAFVHSQRDEQKGQHN